MLRNLEKKHLHFRKHARNVTVKSSPKATAVSYMERDSKYFVNKFFVLSKRCRFSSCSCRFKPIQSLSFCFVMFYLLWACWLTQNLFLNDNNLLFIHPRRELFFNAQGIALGFSGLRRKVRVAIALNKKLIKIIYCFCWKVSKLQKSAEHSAQLRLFRDESQCQWV